MSEELYRISDWAAVFETSDTRKRKGLLWVPTPNKHDGLTFRRIAAHKVKKRRAVDGEEEYEVVEVEMVNKLQAFEKLMKLTGTAAAEKVDVTQTHEIVERIMETRDI